MSDTPAVPGVKASVPARIGLLGNPSDGYNGRVIAAAINDFSATVTVLPAERYAIVNGNGVEWHASDIETFEARLDQLDHGAELLAAALIRLEREHPGLNSQPVRISFETSIPRQVGLAGSSAIVIGAIRALAYFGGTSLPVSSLARLALKAETEILGWAAGPQDRIIQATRGVLDMEFSRGWDPSAWTELDPATLPPMLLAWDPRAAASSDGIHSDVRERFESGDTEVTQAMHHFAALAAAGRRSLDAGTADIEWPDLLHEAHRLRSRLFEISTHDQAMIAIANVHGAAAAFAGSGGAIVCLPRGGTDLDALVDDLIGNGITAIRPSVAAPIA